MKRTAVLGILFGVGGVAGCTSLLGGFTIDEDSGSDASVPDGNQGTDAPVVHDGGPQDGSRPSDAPGGDAAPSCSGGGVTCSPGPCLTGMTACDGGAVFCEQTGTIANGTSCSDASVCDNGVCGACAAGDDCSDAGSCQKSSIVCASGTAVCSPRGNQPNGTACGANMYCDNGSCQPCTNGASCNPDGSVCLTGSTTCMNGTATCNQTGNTLNGTSCGQNMVCLNGSCNPCTQGASCMTGNPCTTGSTDCTSGSPVCVPSNVQNLAACPGGACCAGTCSTCGSVPANAVRACGGMSCTYACDQGFSAQCGQPCLNLQTDSSNCGACGHSCQGAACQGGLCQPILLGHDLLGNSGGTGTVGSIVVTATALFVTDRSPAAQASNVETCPLSGCTGPGGAATTVYSQTGSPDPAFYGISYDPGTGYLYFTAENANALHAITTSGSSVFTVSSLSTPVGTVTDANNVYFGQYQSISYVNKTSGGSVSTVTSAIADYVLGIALDQANGRIWIASQTSVVGCTIAGSCLTFSGGSPAAIQVPGPTPWWMDGATGLYKCASATDCSTANAMHVSTAGGTAFTYDANNVYFTDTTGNVYACSVNGCASPTLITNNMPQAIGMATDSLFVYWLTLGGTIFKVAK